MITVTQLARRCGLSRSTVLYYESVRVLKPPLRTSSNYRAYGEKDVARLEQICVYRNAGLGLGRKKKLFTKKGRAELLRLSLAPWVSRRREELLKLLDQVDAPIAELDRAVLQEAHRREEAVLLMTHPGVGPVTSLGWQPSLPQCSAFALFACVPSAILTEERSLHFQLRHDRLASGQCSSVSNWNFLTNLSHFGNGRASQRLSGGLPEVLTPT